MTEYSQEDIDKIVAEKVAQAQSRQYIADNGVTGFTISLEYLGDQVNRKIIPLSVYQVMEQVYQAFRIDMGLDRPPAQQPQEKKSDGDEPS
jgi:hypothetical protein